MFCRSSLATDVGKKIFGSSVTVLGDEKLSVRILVSFRDFLAQNFAIWRWSRWSNEVEFLMLKIRWTILWWKALLKVEEHALHLEFIQRKQSMELLDCFYSIMLPKPLWLLQLKFGKWILHSYAPSTHKKVIQFKGLRTQ